MANVQDQQFVRSAIKTDSAQFITSRALHHEDAPGFKRALIHSERVLDTPNAVHRKDSHDVVSLRRTFELRAGDADPPHG